MLAFEGEAATSAGVSSGTSLTRSPASSGSGRSSSATSTSIDTSNWTSASAWASPSSPSSENLTREPVGRAPGGRWPDIADLKPPSNSRLGFGTQSEGAADWFVDDEDDDGVADDGNGAG